MDLGKLIHVIGETASRERGKYHLTLGGLIKSLEAVAPDVLVKFAGLNFGPEMPHSYRGYYSDLAFQAGSVPTAGELLEECRSALNSSFEGYKGGDFTMTADTPLWFSSYGDNSGNAIMDAVVVEGVLTLITKQVDA